MCSRARQRVYADDCAKGDNAPYALNGVEVYIRQEAETSRALRDEIVQLVRRAMGVVATPQKAAAAPPMPVAAGEGLVAPPRRVSSRGGHRARRHQVLRAPRPAQRQCRAERDPHLGARVCGAMPSLNMRHGPCRWIRSNGWATSDCGRRSAAPDASFTTFCSAANDGRLHLYYGVTDDGVHGEWRQFVEQRG